MLPGCVSLSSLGCASAVYASMHQVRQKKILQCHRILHDCLRLVDLVEQYCIKELLIFALFASCDMVHVSRSTRRLSFTDLSTPSVSDLAFGDNLKCLIRAPLRKDLFGGFCERWLPRFIR